MKSRSVRAAALVLAFATALLGASPTQAQDDVKITAQVRLRYEGDNRSFQKDVKSVYYTLQRTRVAVGARTEGGTKVFAQLQDSRRWGDEGNTLQDTQNVDLHQAWFLVQDVGFEGLDAKGGRMELAYGQERVIGAVGWDNVGRSFDGLKVRLDVEGTWGDVIGAKISDDVAGADENLFAFVGHGAVLDGDLVIEPLALYRNRRPGGFFQTSVGNYARGEFGRFTVMQDFVYQTGKRSGTDLAAYLISADVFADVSPRADGQFGLGAGVSLYTGDDPEKDDDSAYDQLFPTLHKFHGYMDRAVVIAGTAGLLDINGKGWWKASDRLTIKAAYHAFSTEVDVPLSLDETSKNVGQEIDVVAKTKLTQGLKVELGGSLFFPGDIPKGDSDFGDENATWFYLQGVASI